MRPPLIQRPRQDAGHNRRERGVTLALVAVAIFSIIAMAGLSIDVGTLYQASADAQRAADAAALAAARVLSASGMTTDPANSAGQWSTICASATQVATAVANQNLVGGGAPSEVVTFNAGDKGSDCSSAANTLASFGVNPTVTVKVTQSSLSTYFSRIWGRKGSSVSASATAEVFNPSNSASYSSSGDVVPVQPRCVKPWIIPNYEPWIPSTYSCTTTDCTAFVDKATGIIKNPGIAADTTNAVIGQTVTLTAACKFKNATCTLGRGALKLTQPQANVIRGGGGGGSQHLPNPPNLEYLPGEVAASSVAVPSAASGACSDVSSNFAQAIAGCDQTTKYQCGVQTANAVDLSSNPGPNDTPNGAQCLIHEGGGNSGQDTLVNNGAVPPVVSYPFQIQPGSNNPLIGVGVSSTDVITNSTSIVSLPIYDSDPVTGKTAFTAGGTTPVTIIGFLQVFINSVDNSGNVNVTVVNVAGCGNNASGAALSGTSPVPVRLITPP